MKFPKEWKKLLQEDLVIYGIYRGKYMDKASRRISARGYAQSALRWKYKRHLTKKYIKRGIV